MALRVDEWRMKMSENVQATLTKLRSANDRTVAAFTKGQDRINQSFSRMKTGIKDGIGGAWQGAKASLGEFKEGMLSSLPIPPQMASALGALAGPLGIAIALAAGLTLGLVKSVQAAEAFGVPFRELRNLNLDKTSEQLQTLNDDLLRLSFDKGLNAEAVTRAYYDIQSATGKYGPEVLAMTGRIGEAARALNMDYSAAVNGVSKAMLVFKLQASDLDSILESNAKTVQVGMVNFDQLAQVQTEYAGAAGAVNQKLDTANKVFAALTQSTKDANIAATMTKGAFQDLTKDSTVKGLKSIGVSVYDASGAMRQADDILKDLVPRLSGMTDLQFSTLKEEIGGSEGIRGLLDQAKGSGDTLLQTLETFDSSKFSVSDAIRASNGDLDVMKDMLSNKINAAMIHVGQAVLPLAANITDMLIGAVNGIRNMVAWLKGLYDSSALVRAVWESIFVLLKTGWEMVVAAVKVPLNLIMTIAKAAVEVLSGNFSQAWETVKQGGSDVADNLANMVTGIGGAFGSAFDNVMPKDNQTFKAKASIDTSAAQKAMEGVSGNMVMDPANKPNPGKAADLLGGTGATKGAATTNVKQGVTEVVGGGQQMRTVTVNIQSLVKELTVQTTNMREGSAEIQRLVTDALVRAVNGAELAIAND
jgi:TP901 family phage tail tape measure protein